MPTERNEAANPQKEQEEKQEDTRLKFIHYKNGKPVIVTSALRREDFADTPENRARAAEFKKQYEEARKLPREQLLKRIQEKWSAKSTGGQQTKSTN